MSLQIQQQIKNNASDLRNYVEDLYDWEQSMELKEKKVKSAPQDTTTKPVAPVRGKADIKETVSKDNSANPNKNLKRDANTVQDYYQAWNKFDIDKEIETLDQKDKEEEQSQYVNPYAAMTSSKPRAAPKASIRINSQRSQLIDVNSLKDKANLFYQSSNFKEAIEIYTQCIDKIKTQESILTEEEKVLFLTIYSNRSMTYLKMQDYGKAEQDAGSALQLQPKHIKSLLRRGAARKKLKKFKEALNDYQSILLIQPDHQEAQDESDLVKSVLQERKEKALSGLLAEGGGDDLFVNVNVADISGSDIDGNDENDEDDEEEVDIPQNSKFAHLKEIDKVASDGDDDEVEHSKIAFKQRTENLEINKQSSYHKYEVPERSILHGSHDLGHLIKDIDAKPIKHSSNHNAEEQDDGVEKLVKFGGEEVPISTHTPVHNRMPRNSILKNSPLVQENFHVEIKDIDGKIVTHEESKSKSQSSSSSDEEDDKHIVKFKVQEDQQPRHSFLAHTSSPKKHILKNSGEESTPTDELHSKYFGKDTVINEDQSFSYVSLKNIDGKAVHHERSPRNKPDLDEQQKDNDDEKKVHFGTAQEVTKPSQVPSKSIKPRHSILKTQGSILETPSQEKVLEKIVETKEEKIEIAIKQGVQKAKEEIIDSSSNKSDLTATKFLTEWQHLKGDNQVRLGYLEQVKSENLKNIFREGMEIELISEIFEVLSSQFSKGTADLAYGYLTAIPQLKRFKLSIACLSAKEKQEIKSLIDKLELKEEESSSLRGLYKVK